jgi:hypothetical protein
VFPADLGVPAPRSWVERKYHLTRYTHMPRGGYFPAHEEPEQPTPCLAPVPDLASVVSVKWYNIC